ncbi:hypothetical protein [Peptostreptococcus porci]|uniref:hypothetical protein n=1 Tax=Peptostreptococcus porci TaxID=2652282 RepID=UPI002A82B405|nr:hypothetical protein [Peptostreptococcus porci]MDY4129016.1 hypothetical protein [Peptostreptococcus porci]
MKENKKEMSLKEKELVIKSIGEKVELDDVQIQSDRCKYATFNVYDCLVDCANGGAKQSPRY